eukprot:g4785.t1
MFTYRRCSPAERSAETYVRKSVMHDTFRFKKPDIVSLKAEAARSRQMKAALQASHLVIGAPRARFSEKTALASWLPRPDTRQRKECRGVLNPAIGERIRRSALQFGAPNSKFTASSTNVLRRPTLQEMRESRGKLNAALGLRLRSSNLVFGDRRLAPPSSLTKADFSPLHMRRRAHHQMDMLPKKGQRWTPDCKYGEGRVDNTWHPKEKTGKEWRPPF